MAPEIDVFIMTSHLGNEKIISKDFQDSLILVAKQMAIHKEAKEAMSNKRNQCLDVFKKLLDVVEQQLRIFKECQDAIYEARQNAKQSRADNQNKRTPDPNTLMQENLDYMEREVPDIIRRIFRSMRTYCTDLGKLAIKPPSLDNAYFVKYQIICVKAFYLWTDFELEPCKRGGVNDLTRKHKKDLPRYVRQVANFQRDVLDNSFLKNIDDINEHPEYQSIKDDYPDKTPSDLMKEYLIRIETHVKKKENKMSMNLTQNMSPDEIPTQNQPSQTQRFRERSMKKVEELDRKLIEERGKTFKFGTAKDITDIPTAEYEQGVEGRKVNYKYELRNRIGGGTFGTVYSAVRTVETTIETIAVKRIRISERNNAAHVVRNEIEANEHLYHENIVCYHGQGIFSNNELDLIFEFCETNLRDECRDVGFEPKMIQNLTRQLLEAVEYMHKEGWVHRDIKPGNIFLKTSSHFGGFQLKLGDLGSAHYVGLDVTNAESGAMGDGGCTVIYAAPETLESAPYGRKSDIWSIGRVTFYQSYISGVISRLYSISNDNNSCSMEQPPRQVRIENGNCSFNV